MLKSTNPTLFNRTYIHMYNQTTLLAYGMNTETQDINRRVNNFTKQHTAQYNGMEPEWLPS